MLAVGELTANTTKPGRSERDDGVVGVLFFSDFQQEHVQDDKEKEKRNICLI